MFFLINIHKKVTKKKTGFEISFISLTRKFFLILWNVKSKKFQVAIAVICINKISIYIMIKYTFYTTQFNDKIVNIRQETNN